MNDNHEGTTAERHWVLVEGPKVVPKVRYAEFLGRWLLSAVKADEMLQEQFKQNRDFARLYIMYLLSFSLAATKFLELLMGNLCFSVGRSGRDLHVDGGNRFFPFDWRPLPNDPAAITLRFKDQSCAREARGH
jgi:hypothetical protein